MDDGRWTMDKRKAFIVYRPSSIVHSLFIPVRVILHPLPC